MKKRCLFVVSLWLLIITSGLCYYWVINSTDFYFVCPIYKYFGIECFTCGITTYFKNMFIFNFSNAFLANQVLFFMIPIWVVYLILYSIEWVLHGEIRKSLKITGLILLIITIAGLFILFIFRNFL